MADGIGYGLVLLWAELNGSITGTLSVLDFPYSFLDFGQETVEPNVSILSLISVESCRRDAHCYQSAIHIICLVAFGTLIVGGTLDMLDVVSDTLHVGTFVKNVTDGLGEHLFVRIVGNIVVNKNFTDLQKVGVLSVIDGENVQKPRLGDSIFNAHIVWIFIVCGYASSSSSVRL